MGEVSGDRADEIGLLDAAVVVAEHWLLLVLAPLIAGVIAFGVLTITTPRHFESEALLRINASEAALMRSARVLNPAMLGSDYLEGYAGSLSRARQDLVDNVLTINPEPETDMYRVRATAETAEGANDLLDRIIISLIENSTPTSSEARLIEIRLEQARAAISQLEASLQSLNTLLQSFETEGGPTSTPLGDIGQSAVTLVSNIEQRYAQVFELEKQLAGTVTAQDVIQEPTLPDGSQPRGLLTRVILVSLGVGFIALVAAFIRAGLQSASHDPHQQVKVNRIRKAFWLKPIENGT